MKVFGIVLIIIGSFIVYSISGTFLSVVSGTKLKATIVAVEKVKNKRFTYLYYPIFQFNYKNKILHHVSKSHSIDLKEIGSEIYIYYSEKYGISRGFTAFEIIFSVIGISFIFFGLIALFKR